jgi:hypothetical protein
MTYDLDTAHFMGVPCKSPSRAPPAFSVATSFGICPLWDTKLYFEMMSLPVFELFSDFSLDTPPVGGSLMRAVGSYIFWKGELA